MNSPSEVKKKKTRKIRKSLDSKADLSVEMKNVISEIDGEILEDSRKDKRIKMFIAKGPEINIEKKQEDLVDVTDAASLNEDLDIKADVSCETVTSQKKSSFSFFESELKKGDKPIVFTNSDIINKVETTDGNIGNLDEKTKIDLLNEASLRGFSIPSFSFKNIKNKSEVIKDEVSHETNTSFWFNLSKGILLGFCLFGMSLIIAKFAGKVLNPDLTQALDVRNIESYVLINNENVSYETPKTFKVNDLNTEIFKNPIFKDVKIGDIFLVYEKSAKIVIFRESLKKIISVISL